MNTELRGWAKKLLTPQFVGILVLILVSVAFIIIKGSGGKPAPSLLSRANSTTPQAARQPVASPGNSYNLAVNLIRPAVVGISLPGAQPFVQAWGPDRAWARPV